MDHLDRSFQAVSKAIYFLASRYENVCFPLRPDFSFDLIACLGKNNFRVKVIKTDSVTPSGQYIVNLRKSSDKGRKENFATSTCDYLFVDSPKGEYFIPRDKIHQVRAITLTQYSEFLIIPG